MLYTPICPPGAATERSRVETPAHIAERRRERLLRLTERFAREDVEATIDALIARLDDADGDPDLELNGDEMDTAVVDFSRRDPAYRPELLAASFALEDAEAIGDEEDHTGSEECFVQHRANGPGCPIADPDHGVEETTSGASGDPSWTEWHTRGRHKIDVGGAEIVGRDLNGRMLEEDDEDDEPKELAWTEWHGRPWPVAHEGSVGMAANDDDEEDEHPDAEPDREAGSWAETGERAQPVRPATYVDDDSENDCALNRCRYVERARRAIGQPDASGTEWRLPTAAFHAPASFRASELSR